MMFDLHSLPIPILQAPMAGGPSTPALTSAVNDAGGLGHVAAGYLSAEALEAAIIDVRCRSTAAFGVNIFVPEYRTEPENPDDGESVELTAYRAALAPTAARYDVQLPERLPVTDDDFDAKIEVVARHRPASVSFTFGLPEVAVIRRLQGGGSTVLATVTSVEEARQACAAKVDALCVQGPEAGGHRATFEVHDRPGTTGLATLVRETLTMTELPVIAAGGIHSGQQIAELLRLGASAVQVGTMFLRCPEAGTKQAHRDALAAPEYENTMVTRAFSGRPARSLINEFAASFSDLAPEAYPQVNSLTAPIRAASDRRNDPRALNLWAGTGHRHARPEPAAAVVHRLWRAAVAADPALAGRGARA
jgi:NAD(P)H-dependent flavin oxidoreductase YrpB (nitropropane dioxygenase family)